MLGTNFNVAVQFRQSLWMSMDECYTYWTLALCAGTNRTGGLVLTKDMWWVSVVLVERTTIIKSINKL